MKLVPMALNFNFMYNERITFDNVMKFGNTLQENRIATFNYDKETGFAYAASYEESYSPWFAYNSKDNCFYEPDGYDWEKKQWVFLKVEGLTTLKEASEYFSVGQAIIDNGAMASSEEQAELKSAWRTLHEQFSQSPLWRNKT